jgi:hypothetical protein
VKSHARLAHDPTIYPTEDKSLGEESLQRFIIELLRPLVERWLSERGVEAFTGADLFIYWRQHDATRRVAPDVFVLPGVRPGRRLKSWKTWETGTVPTFALEVVSGDADKDYVEAPRAYDEMGASELIVFDPDYEIAGDRFRFQVFRRLKGRGLVRVEATNADRVKSRALACFIRSVGAGESTRLRVASGEDGQDLFATAEERLDREKAGRLAAEAEVLELRRKLKARKHT